MVNFLSGALQLGHFEAETASALKKLVDLSNAFEINPTIYSTATVVSIDGTMNAIQSMIDYYEMKYRSPNQSPHALM